MGTANRPEPAKRRRNQIGVVGSGTMGSGIALTALLADLPVALYDVEESMLARARQYVETHLERKQRLINLKYLQTTTRLEDLAGANVVIEAAPEELKIKQEIFGRLDAVCPPETILATNTSTLAVTAIAAATGRPDRVGGMHFFNPAPVMPLVEVVRGKRSASETIEALVALARKMGKTPVVTEDTPGFIVNRVARPFYGEALRLLGEKAAAHEQIDQIVRQGAGFRMGPFELMDLIGIDINYAATRSVYEQTYGEARYRPHWIQAQMVNQRALGRKTGSGFYEYDQKGAPIPGAARGAAAGGNPTAGPDEAVFISAGSWAPGIRELCEQAGYEVLSEIAPGSGRGQGDTIKAGIVAAGKDEGAAEVARHMDLELPADIPMFVQCADVTAAEASAWVENPGRLVGFDGLFFTAGEAVTLAPGPLLQPEPRRAAQAFVASLGKQAVWVEDSPGLVLPRIIAALANEAAFAASEGVADADTIDLAMLLGTSYPKGPLAWAREIGVGRIVAIMHHLRDEYGEERYRVAPRLRREARIETLR